jgi:dienelactone hydrolase
VTPLEPAALLNVQRIIKFAALATLAALSREGSAQQPLAIPVTTHVGGTTHVLRLEAFLYRPAETGAFPLVIINHGSAGANPKQSIRAETLAAYFVRHGMTVVVPMRRGRGRSEGTSLESEERNCDPASWTPGIEAALDDITAVIDYAKRLPSVDSSRTLLVGVSRGGFLSVAYAARGARRASITGVVNFVGAWVAQREDQCPRDYNALSFEQFGRDTRTPMLWLYGDDDPFNSTSSIEAYARMFKAGGGKLGFALIRDVPENGHALPNYPRLWRDRTDVFIQSLRLAGRR